MGIVTTYRDAINLATIECMREDQTVFCYGIGVPDHKKIFGTTIGILEEFGSARCFDTPISEDSFMTGKLEPTNSPYAMAKIAAIEIGRSLNTQFNHNVINLMPTNLYGPNDFYSETDSHVIPGLIYRMHKAKLEDVEKFNIWGTGTPLREFLYVDDLALAIKFVIENEVNVDLLNIGSGEEISIKELAEKIQTVVGYKGYLEFDESKPDGAPFKMIDGSKGSKLLGWKPAIDLESGLKKTVDWYLQRIDQSSELNLDKSNPTGTPFRILNRSKDNLCSPKN